MTVRIRMKKMGRTHRPYFRVCAMDKRSPRDGRVIEELGTYDPMCPGNRCAGDAESRTNRLLDRRWVLNPVTRLPVLIKKYGTDGTHLDAQKEAIERLGKRKEYTPVRSHPNQPRRRKKKNQKPKPNLPLSRRQPAEEPAAEEAPAEAAAAEESPDKPSEGEES